MARDRKRTLEIRLRFSRVALGRRQRDSSCYTIDLDFPPPFLGCFNRRHRFADAAPSVTELAKSRIAAASQDGPIYEGSEVLPALVADRHSAEFDRVDTARAQSLRAAHRGRQFAAALRDTRRTIDRITAGCNRVTLRPRVLSLRRGS
jgi:hypothetical protein